jgi:putative flippase GtrA
LINVAVSQQSSAKQFALYAINGIVTAAFYALVGIFLTWIGFFSIQINLAITYILTATFHFFGTNYVFGQGKKTLRADVAVRYGIAIGLNFALNIAAGSFLNSATHNEYLATILAPVLPTVINFPVLKFFVFQKKKEQPHGLQSE